MPPVARQSDPSTGHSCWAVPQSPTSSASSVFANGQKVLRTGDGYSAHPFTCPPPIRLPHAGTVAGGSGSVHAEGAAVARVGDPISCGGTIASGSGDVQVGG